MNHKKHHTTDDYRVEWLSIDSVKPSPENDEIYGKVSDSDSQMGALIDSIRSRGLEEPIIVSADGFIVSGHRRYSRRAGGRPPSGLGKVVSVDGAAGVLRVATNSAAGLSGSAVLLWAVTRSQRCVRPRTG